jgi:hypothetical protein
VDYGRVDRGVGVVVEVLEPFGAGEAGGVDAAQRAAFLPVIAFGHHQLGQEWSLGQ